MLFNSYQFILVFLPITFFGFFLVGKYSRLAGVCWLVCASLVFYGYWNAKLVLLLLASASINYLFGKSLARSEKSRRPANRRRLLLAAAIVLNLATLGFFKYANFFITNFNAFLPSATSISLLNVVLPIGISFYTFTQIAFLVDCYQNKVTEPNAAHYLLFVTYFPHLIAGPVLHHSQIMPQFSRLKTYRLNWNSIAIGIAVFTIGLSKKVLIADPLGEHASIFFDNMTDAKPLFIASWFGVLTYTFQIYFDFSGYSDMAIGMSLLFGIRLPLNFNSPYKATSIIEFWRRWHITLAYFLRDYLYIPLGGNRKGERRRYVNLLITMLLGGLWHGASWTFVLWGAAHGVFLAINHAWRSLCLMPEKIEKTAQWTVACWALTFIGVCFAWVLFRANSLASAVQIYGGLVGLNGGFDHAVSERGAVLLGLAALVALFAKNTQQHFSIQPMAIQEMPPAWKPSLGWLVAILALFTLSVFKLNAPSPFLYFQF